MLDWWLMHLLLLLGSCFDFLLWFNLWFNFGFFLNYRHDRLFDFFLHNRCGFLSWGYLLNWFLFFLGRFGFLGLTSEAKATVVIIRNYFFGSLGLLLLSLKFVFSWFLLSSMGFGFCALLGSCLFPSFDELFGAKGLNLMRLHFPFFVLHDLELVFLFFFAFIITAFFLSSITPLVTEKSKIALSLSLLSSLLISGFLVSFRELTSLIVGCLRGLERVRFPIHGPHYILREQVTQGGSD